MTKCMEKVFMFGMMDEHTMDNGKMGKCLEKANFIGQMVLLIEENI